MAKEQKQNKLFADMDDGELWREHWKDMPEFKQDDLMPYQSLIVHFENLEDRNEFAKLIEQHITSETKFVWYPAADIATVSNKRYKDGS